MRRWLWMLAVVVLGLQALGPAAFAGGDSQYRLRAWWHPRGHVPLGVEVQIRADLEPFHSEARLEVSEGGTLLGVLDPGCGCLGWTPTREGLHGLEIRALDADGRELARANLSIPVMAYQLSLWTPPREIEPGQAIDLTVLTLPGYQVREVQVYQVEGDSLIPVGPPVPDPRGSLSWQPDGVGEYTLLARAMDAAGQVLAESEPLVVRVGDGEGGTPAPPPPDSPGRRYSLAVTVSSDHVAVGEGVTLSAAVSPRDEIESIWIEVPDGTRHQILAAEGSVDWTPLEPGHHEVRFWAVTTDGRTVARTTEVISAAYRQVLGWARPNPVRAGESVRIFGWARPEGNIKEILVYHLDGAGGSTQVGVIAGARGYASWRAEAAGEHTFLLSARDLWDNPVAQSERFSVTVQPQTPPPPPAPPEEPPGEPSPPAEPPAEPPVSPPAGPPPAPHIEVTAAPNPVPFGHAVRITAQATPEDQVGALLLEFFGDRAEWVTVDRAAGASHEFEWAPPQLGSSILRIRAVDHQGNTLETQLVPIVAQRYQVRAAADSALLAPGEAVTITARATPAQGVERLRFTVRSPEGNETSPEGDEAEGSAGSFTWTPQVGGAYVVAVEALDPAGNLLAGTEISVLVYEVRAMPDRSGLPLGQSVQIALAANPPHGVTQLAVYQLVGTDRWVPIGRPVRGSSGQVSWTPPDPRAYTLQVRAMAEGGREVARSNFEITAYTIRAVASRDTAEVGDFVAVTAITTPDTTDYMTIWWQDEERNWHPVEGVPAVRGGVGSFVVRMQRPGRWNLRVVASDTAGQVLATSATMTVTVFPESETP